MSILSYRDLKAWQKAMDIAAESYRVTGVMPRSEMFGFISQIRRSGASVPANIAEGYGRGTSGTYVQFLKIARGSLQELETHVLLAERVGLLQGSQIAALLANSDQLGKMLTSLIRAIQKNESAGLT